MSVTTEIRARLRETWAKAKEAIHTEKEARDIGVEAYRAAYCERLRLCALFECLAGDHALALLDDLEKAEKVIYNLETRCDPAGDTQELVERRQQVTALEKAVVEIRECLEKAEAERDKLRAELEKAWSQHGPAIKAMLERAEKAEAERDALQAAIREHRDAKGDDRCWLDDAKLYSALDDGTSATVGLPPKAEFLSNCERFWECRKAGITYEPNPELESARKVIEATEALWPDQPAQAVEELYKVLTEYHENFPQ